MTTEENLAAMKEIYRAWHETKGGSVDKWLELMHDDIDILNIGEEPDGLSFAKDRSSKREAHEYFDAILDAGTMVHWTPETFVADGDNIAMFGKCAWRLKSTGKVAEGRVAHLFKFEDGKISEFTEVFDSAQVLIASQPSP